jgi:hypothetical protein
LADAGSIGQPWRQRLARAADAAGGRMPLYAVTEAARLVLAAECGRRKGLQGVAHDELLADPCLARFAGFAFGRCMARGDGIEQFADQHRGSRAAVARSAPGS